MTWLALIFAIETGLVSTEPTLGWEFVEPPVVEQYAAADVGVEVAGVIRVGGTVRWGVAHNSDWQHYYAVPSELLLGYEAWASIGANGFRATYRHEFTEREIRRSFLARYDCRIGG